jgi:hypothetical protein
MRSATRPKAPSTAATTWPARPDPAAWQALPDDLQLTLAQEAMRRAAETLADHADLLAAEIEGGELLDQGGPDALRLFANVVRATNSGGFASRERLSGVGRSPWRGPSVPAAGARIPSRAPRMGWTRWKRRCREGSTPRPRFTNPLASEFRHPPASARTSP